jgi:predicted nucleic acid-binding protein
VTVLADTSIWVDYLRSARTGRAAAMDRLLASGDLVICGPVVAELLAGTAARQRQDLWQVLGGVRWFDFSRAHWRRVGEVAAALGERGATVPLTDIEIAVAAIESGAALWTRDGDFERIAQVVPELKRYRAPA